MTHTIFVINSARFMEEFLYFFVIYVVADEQRFSSQLLDKFFFCSTWPWGLPMKHLVKSDS